VTVVKKKQIAKNVDIVARWFVVTAGIVTGKLGVPALI